MVRAWSPGTYDWHRRVVATVKGGHHLSALDHFLTEFVGLPVLASGSSSASHCVFVTDVDDPAPRSPACCEKSGLAVSEREPATNP
jgi:hypothetical protein